MRRASTLRQAIAGPATTAAAAAEAARYADYEQRQIKIRSMPEVLEAIGLIVQHVFIKAESLAATTRSTMTEKIQKAP